MDGGRGDYPRARRLPITADAGGSNGYRTRALEAELAALAAAETGLEITAATRTRHPPGPYRLACLDDLYCLATAEGITVASEIRTAC